MLKNKKIDPTTTCQNIESIEQDYWGDIPDYDSHLVTTIFNLRKKNLGDFSAEDLRIVIGQNYSLPILIPMALDVLEKNILVSGDNFPGDLLQNVLTISSDFWIDNPDLKDRFKKIVVKNTKRIKGSGLTEKEKEKLFTLYEQFLQGAIQDGNVLQNYKRVVQASHP